MTFNIIKPVSFSEAPPDQQVKARDPNDPEARIDFALEFAIQFGGIDGGDHKDWVIDQMVRALTGGDYVKWVSRQEAGEGEPDARPWPVGIAP